MKTPLKFGLITGLISCFFLFGFFSLGVWLNAKFGWGLQVSTIRGVGGLLSIPVQAIGIYMAMQNVKQLSGGLTYLQALKTGALVALTIAVTVALFGFLYTTVFNPGYADFMVHDAQKAMIAAGKSQQEINQDSVKVAAMYTPGSTAFQALVGQFVTGVIMSLILGAFVRGKK